MFKFLFILINIFIFSGCSLKPEIEYNDSVIPTELKNSLDKNSNLEYIQPNWENFVKNDKLKELIKSLRFKMLLVPVATITGTLLFSAFASLLLTQWSVFDCMAVGSGFAYYSLSSILITQFKEPSMGLQLATELGTIALLANIFREMMALLGAPLIRKYFGRLAPISAAGVNSMDVLLPSITRYSGKDMIPIAIFHGILIDMSVPVFVSFFCNL